MIGALAARVPVELGREGATFANAHYYGALSTDRPIDGQTPQNLENYRVLRGLPVDRAARR